MTVGPLAIAFTIETTRISAVGRAASARRHQRDDIPVARRSRPAPRRSRSRGFGLFLACLVVCGGSGAAVLMGPQLMARLKRTPPAPLVPGIPEPPAADGRLLGHFPYEEVRPDQLIVFEPGIQLHIDAADALDGMLRAAAAEGVDLRLLSGYRSHDLQDSIFFEVASERNQTAEERAQVSAPPGYSEHSTGFAVDLGDGQAPETHLSTAFEQTRTFRWLQDNAARYHFVMSFPDGNSQGVSYEPWHWRFEGTADALRRFEAARRLARRSF